MTLMSPVPVSIGSIQTIIGVFALYFFFNLGVSLMMHSMCSKRPFGVISLYSWHSLSFHFRAVRGALLSYGSVILNHKPLISILKS